MKEVTESKTALIGENSVECVNAFIIWNSINCAILLD